jgi:hypothetical protein
VCKEQLECLVILWVETILLPLLKKVLRCLDNRVSPWVPPLTPTCWARQKNTLCVLLTNWVLLCSQLDWTSHLLSHQEGHSSRTMSGAVGVIPGSTSKRPRSLCSLLLDNHGGHSKHSEVTNGKEPGFRLKNQLTNTW